RPGKATADFVASSNECGARTLYLDFDLPLRTRLLGEMTLNPLRAKKTGQPAGWPRCGNLELRSWWCRRGRHRAWGLTRHESCFHQRHPDRRGRDMVICPKAKAAGESNHGPG